MLDKTEAAIKNQQSRDTGNIRCTRHRTGKQTKNTTQHRKLKTRATQTPLKERVGKILVRNGIKFPTIF